MSNYKLQSIDQNIIHLYKCLDNSDKCYYFGDYAGSQGYQHSDMNQLIFNFKKPMSRKGEGDWSFKKKSVYDIASLIFSSPSWKALKKYLWIPMPPSKREDDPDYDARLVQVLEKLKNKDNDFKYEEVLANKKSRKAAHSLKNEPRPTKDEHLNNFIVENNLRNKNVEAIVIFDDVIYSGASFKAAKEVLKKHYGPILICGLFIARHIGQEEGEPDSRLNLAKH